MRRWGLAVALSLTAHGAWAQNPKDTCVDSSERGQKLVDDRKLLAARAAFLSCASDSCPGPVRRDCQNQLDELKKNIPSIVVRAKNDDGSDVTQGEVWLDGVDIGGLDGRVIDTDPGPHRVRVELAGGKRLEQDVVLAAGDKSRSVTFGSKPGTASSSAPDTKARWSTVRSLGFITIWVGVAGVTAGVVSQVLALIMHGNAITLQDRAGTSVCPGLDARDYSSGSPPPGDCTNAVSEESQAVTAQSIAIGLFIGGLVVVAGGVVLFAVGGNKPVTSALHVTPLVGPHIVGLGLSAAF